MRVPLSWLRDFMQSDASAHALAAGLTARGLTVESVIEQPRPDHIVVGRIEALQRHPNADRLFLSSVDVGRERLQIVTGAQNVRAGDKIPVALPGAVVFERTSDEVVKSASANSAGNGGRGTKRIERSVLRGVESVGMMCSPDELALPGEYEDGIVILEDDAPVGEDFWKAARLPEAVLDVEVPSNRPDCLSIAGLAREAAAAVGATFRAAAPEDQAGSYDSPITVEIGDPAVCRRLLGQFFRGVKTGRSPIWMVLRLQAAGVRSINSIVDISNYALLETGQPLHFYDADAIRGGRIIARAAFDGEAVTTLDGVARTLAPGTPVIADAQGAIGIAGIMGGAASAVTAATKNVFVESANFVGSAVRRASLALRLRTEGALRHEKDLPLELPEQGRRLAAAFLSGDGGAASRVEACGEAPQAPHSVRVRPARVNAVLGSSFSSGQMRAALDPIGIDSHENGELSVTIPYWRTDVREEVDIIEEIARGIGYEAIAAERTVAAPQAIDESAFDQETKLADTFAALGYHEIVSVALQGSRVISAWERSGLKYWEDVVAVVNPLSEDHRFLRPSLLPGVLMSAAQWWPQCDGELRLFEIGHVFRPLPANGKPSQARDGAYVDSDVLEWRSACGLAAFSDAPESAGRQSLDKRLLTVKGELESILRTFIAGPLRSAARARMYFHPGAAGIITSDGMTVAKFGRLDPRLASAYELPLATYAFALYLENIPRRKPVEQYRPLPKFPAVKRDIAVVIDEAVPAGDVVEAAAASGAGHLEHVTAFDEYSGRQIGEGKKSVALTLTFRKADGTITDEEANSLQGAVVATLAQAFGATLRG
ncbi:MAG: phenylalanine--tRNA ligase subunit beta [Candidatus Eremiobacter antarcticus]|nr:phenylalanine--tRNA ligase subunit beta [Candidatus Eremiobacteraeota bacterium]MBC5808377.1 phenylalanine--tRNA ligase subunit beta [Candidatus Eremiobacteraeota bacterium]PZR63743.1 MAG: phenylalanine--tRNA ligase subunit beta [Candidatus Eremiobacter sp. RRmetagenome_bin22]